MKNPFYKFQLPANAYKLIDTSVGFQVAGDYHGYDSDKDGKAGIVISVDNKPIVEVENKEILFKTDAKDNYKILSSFIGLDGNSIQGTKNKSIAELAVPLLKNIENIETKGKNTFAERSALITYKKELNRLFELQERGKGKSEKGEELQKAQKGDYLKGAGNYNWKRNTDGSFEYMKDGKVGVVKKTDSNYNQVESNLKKQIPSLFNESSSEVDGYSLKPITVTASGLNKNTPNPPIIPEEIAGNSPIVPLEKETKNVTNNTPALKTEPNSNYNEFSKWIINYDNESYINNNNEIADFKLTQEQSDEILSPSKRNITAGDADVPILNNKVEAAKILTNFIRFSCK